VFLCCLGFIAKLVPTFAQEIEVKDLPDEVRQLPNSFKEKYQGSAYNYESSVSWLDKAKAWFIDLLDRWFRVNSKKGASILENLETIFYILVLLGVVYIIVKMVLNKEGRWLFRRKKEKANTLEFEITENIQQVNFENLIQEAVQNKEYRLAIRYNYLLLLKKLDQYKIITYDPQKTTYDYSLDLEGTAHSKGFNKATYYYTYIWYGEFSIDAEEYTTASLVYAQILKSFKNA